MGMEIFLVVTITAMLIVSIIETAPKRLAFQCQQAGATKRPWMYQEDFHSSPPHKSLVSSQALVY